MTKNNTPLEGDKTERTRLWEDLGGRKRCPINDEDWQIKLGIQKALKELCTEEDCPSFQGCWATYQLECPEWIIDPTIVAEIEAELNGEKLKLDTPAEKARALMRKLKMPTPTFEDKQFEETFYTEKWRKLSHGSE